MSEPKQSLTQSTLATVHSSLECKVWPLDEVANGLYCPAPPKQSEWGLQIISRWSNTPLLKSVLNFGLRWPPALLEPLFSAASAPQSAYHPSRRTHRSVNIFSSPVKLPPNSRLAGPFAG